jgi:putative flippase GtrA
MVSSSNLPSPGTLSDPSEPLVLDPARSRRQAGSEDGDATTLATAAPELIETSVPVKPSTPVEVTTTLDATGIAEAVGTVGSVKSLDSRASGTDEIEDLAGPKPAKTPLHWVVGAHWLGRWRTPVAVRMWRYGAGSVVAFATSTVVLFFCLSVAHLGAISATVIAFLAGAVPNWVLNRRWAWEKRGRDGMVKETTLYVTVSLIALAVSSAADKFTAVEATHLHSNLEKSLLVTFSYMFSVVVLTGLKYVAYDRLVFVDRGRSRNQVLTTTEQNR